MTVISNSLEKFIISFQLKFKQTNLNIWQISIWCSMCRTAPRLLLFQFHTNINTNNFCIFLCSGKFVSSPLPKIDHRIGIFVLKLICTEKFYFLDCQAVNYPILKV